MLKELTQKKMVEINGGAELVVSYTIFGRTLVLAYDLQDGKEINKTKELGLSLIYNTPPPNLNGTTTTTTTTSSVPAITVMSSSSGPDYSNVSSPPYAV